LTAMAHIHEKIDFTSEVFIVYKNKVLLRMHDKIHIWLSVGGHIELHEDPNEAALREVKEEVGLDVLLWKGNQKFGNEYDNEKYTELIPPVALIRNRVSAVHEHVTLVYFARAMSDKISVQYEDDRSNECVWVTKEGLAEMDLEPHVRFYAALALDTLGSNV
ncbi:MAG: NUDIX domain-containing protein, partial [bacterium]|nr:NUDIX domain-containing protein [bacterium]